MIRFMKSALVGIAAGVVLVGCGGSGGDNNRLSDLFPLTGQLNSSSAILSSGLQGGTGTQQITVRTADGGNQTITVSVPATGGAEPDNSIALVTQSVLFDNMSVGTAGGANKAQGGNPGDILVKESDQPDTAYTALAGVHVDSTGRIVFDNGVDAIAVPRGMWDAKIVGPLYISDPNNSSRFLTIQDGLYYHGYVNTLGELAFPRSVSGAIDGNGGNTLHLGVTANFHVTENSVVTSPFEGDVTYLRVVKSNGDLKRKVNIVNGLGNYFNYYPTSNDPIPAEGVEAVHFWVWQAGTQP